jgi:hypothetical protein
MTLGYRKNEPLPRDLCSPGSRSGFLDRIYYKLGAKTRKLPKGFKGKFRIDGHDVVVFPSRAHMTEGGAYYRGGRRVFPTKRVSGRRYGLTRVFFLVGRGQLIPAGRIQQSKFCGYRGERKRRR